VHPLRRLRSTQAALDHRRRSDTVPSLRPHCASARRAICRVIGRALLERRPHVHAHLLAQLREAECISRRAERAHARPSSRPPDAGVPLGEVLGDRQRIQTTTSPSWQA